MKNKKLLIKFLLITLIFVIKIPVYAQLDIDYEVTSVKATESGGKTYLTMKGWGRLFSGYCTGSECWAQKTKPYLVKGFDNMDRLVSEANRKYESGYAKNHNKGTTNSSDACGDKYNGKDVRYIFKMSALDSETGKVLKTITMDRAKDAANIPATTLTYSLCQKDGNSCSWGGGSYVSGCYHDVGWYFKFDVDDILSSPNSTSGSFIFRLTITSGYDNATSGSVNVTILTGAIDADDEFTRKYIKADNIGSTVVLTAARPNGWNKAGYSSSKYWSQMRRGPYYEYKIHNTTKDKNTGETWYYIQHWKYDKSSKTAGKYVWVPSSWITPKVGTAPSKITPPDFVSPFQDCDSSNSEVKSTTKEATSCSEETILDYTWEDGKVNSTCTAVDKVFYRMDCSETASVTIRHNNGKYLRLNGSLNYNIHLEGEKKCSFKFDFDYYNEKYNAYLAQYNKYVGNGNTKLADLALAELEKIKKIPTNYKNFISDNILTSRTSTHVAYTYPSVTASIKLMDTKTKQVSTAQNGVFVPSTDATYNDQLYLNSITTARNSGQCKTLNGVEVCNLNVETTNPLTKNLVFSGDININNYIITQYGNEDIIVEVNGIGSHGKWKAKVTCNQDISRGDFYYREVDLATPFAFRNPSKTACDNAGGNWCDRYFDFTRVAGNQNNSNSNFAYSITLSKKNIEDIKNNNYTNKKSGYGYTITKEATGQTDADCVTDSNNQVSCDKFFSKYTTSTSKGN